MLKKSFIFCCIFSLLLSSCAYFNTFHNTKKLHKEARKEREKRQGDKPSPSELKKYDDTIEKASKILELYPNSKYVDDALMILGESFYYKKEFVKAQRKFQEIIAYFPDGSYFYKAKIWLAKTDLQLQDYSSARLIITELLTSEKVNREVSEEGRFLLGEIFFQQEKYVSAEKVYQKSAANSKNKLIKAKSYFQLGESQIKNGKYKEAVESFRSALKHSPNREFAFDAKLNWGRALKLAGNFKDSGKVCAELLDDRSLKNKHGFVKLEVADCIYHEGQSLKNSGTGKDSEYSQKIADAVEQYQIITLENKRTQFSASAFYHLGKIHEEFGDFAKAKKNYERVKTEFNRSELVKDSNKRAKDLGDLIRLNSLVKKSQGQEIKVADGSRSVHLSELELLLLEHGVHPELRFLKKRKKTLAQNRAQSSSKTNGALAKKEAEDNEIDKLVNNKLQLAEVYLFEFGKIDSALLQYEELIELFPKHPASAKALYSIAFIYENEFQNKAKTDSLHYLIVERFPGSSQAIDARKKLGLPVKYVETDYVERLFKNAEYLLFETNKTTEALSQYNEIIERHPDSKYVPKALLASGWIHETQFANNEKAREIYQRLREQYPDSDFSKKINQKLDAVAKTSEAQTSELKVETPGIEEAQESPEDELRRKRKELLEEEDELLRTEKNAEKSETKDEPEVDDKIKTKKKGKEKPTP